MKTSGIKYFPVTLFASVMGIAGVAIALQLIEDMYGLPGIASMIFIVLAVLMFVINSVIFIYRVIAHRDEVVKDFNHPVKMNFFGAISISLLLLAVLFYELHHATAFVMWGLGASFQLAVTLLLLTKIIWEKEFQLAQFNPTWIIPIVGNIVVPLAGIHFASLEINWIFFSVGIVFTMIYLTLLIYRLFFLPALPLMLTPTLFIVLAPLGIGFVSYVNLRGHVDVFAYILYGLGFYIGLLYLFQWKRFIRAPFTVAWWAYLFPSAAMTTATYFIYEIAQDMLFKIIFHMQISGLVVLSGYLTVRTIKLAVNGDLCIKQD